RAQGSLPGLKCHGPPGAVDPGTHHPQEAVHMARPGAIDGKTKATLYLDEEVHRALRIRAAETGESMGDIAERALRRELGMMEITINVVEVGEAHMERVASFEASLSGT